jgi:hypothetical protein
LPYVLNDEVGGDLAAGRRRPEWLWLALRGDRLVARAGWWSRPGDRHPQVMDIFDIDGGIGDGVQLLETALPAVVPAGATPPQYSRFLPGGLARPPAHPAGGPRPDEGTRTCRGKAVRRTAAPGMATRMASYASNVQPLTVCD